MGELRLGCCHLGQGNRNNGVFATTPAAVGIGSPGVALVSGVTNSRRDTEFAVVRAGVNYKFGSY